LDLAYPLEITRELSCPRMPALADRLPTRRWAAITESVAPELLLIVLRPPRETAQTTRRASQLMLHEAIDPNRRPDLLVAVESGLHQYRSRAA
jgi:hypothetical protein